MIIYSSNQEEIGSIKNGFVIGLDNKEYPMRIKFIKEVTQKEYFEWVEKMNCSIEDIDHNDQIGVYYYEVQTD